MLKFPPAATDYFAQADVVLEGRTRLVQSLRGFNCRYSCLLYAYKLFEHIQLKATNLGPDIRDPEGMLWFLDHALSNAIAIDVRAMCDPRADALGARTIAESLNDSVSRAGLCEYLDSINDGSLRITEAAERERYFDYVAKYMSILATKAKPGKDDHPLVSKVSVVRRWANKIIAHVTLDDYRVDVEDLHDIFLALTTMAVAIEFLMGEAAYPGDLQVCEEQAVRGAENLLGKADIRRPQYLRLIRLWLPHWVRSGQEFSFGAQNSAQDWNK